MNLTLKDMPEELHRRLREAADESGRSLNKLILFTLEQTFCSRKSDKIALVARVRQRRNGMSTWLEDESIERAVAEGRP